MLDWGVPLAADGFQAFTPQHYLLIGIFLSVRASGTRQKT